MIIRDIWVTKTFIHSWVWNDLNSFTLLIVDGIDNCVHGGVIVVMPMYLQIIQSAIQRQNYGMEIATLQFLNINIQKVCL